MRSAAIEPPRLGFELQRRFRASPERVFRAWTQPSALREWWCPPGWAACEIEVDLRLGGAFRIVMRRLADGTGPLSVCGQFLEVRPPERLVFTWRWEGAFASMPETVVTLELRGTGAETLLLLRHENFAEPGINRQHRSGWIAACNRLERLLTPPTPPGAPAGVSG
jgi:uncharacterized protein YndB with AHSA1/START domain